MSGCNADANTEVEIMWTNQHGTGPLSDGQVESQVTLQYMCQEDSKEFNYHTIRNGRTLATQNFREGLAERFVATTDRGLHEPFGYYNAYEGRERNKGKPDALIYTFKPWCQIINSPFVFPYISYRSSGEKLLEYQ